VGGFTRVFIDIVTGATNTRLKYRVLTGETILRDDRPFAIGGYIQSRHGHLARLLRLEMLSEGYFNLTVIDRMIADKTGQKTDWDEVEAPLDYLTKRRGEGGVPTVKDAVERAEAKKETGNE